MLIHNIYNNYTPTEWMHMALAQAEKAIYLSDPNPRVGCVLVDENNHCIGQGYTQAAGKAHAEVMALDDALQKGSATKGATAYVTLEPCSHFGRTPPCSQVLINAGIKKVVIATLDPNPLVAGQGVIALKNAGIEVEHGLLAFESQELNIGFFSRMLRQKPWVRLKIATSLDGKVALSNGKSQWITGQQARDDAHKWRARASSILTGIGTILADDPLLNIRAIEVDRQPWHAIVDTQLRTPLDARILNNLNHKSKEVHAKILIYTASENQQKIAQLKQKGATICLTPKTKSAELDLSSIIANLHQHECNELHIEAGSILSSALLKENLVDEILLYMAPRFIGQGQEFIQNLMLSSLEDTLNFQFHSLELMGADARMLLRKPV